MSTAAPTDQRFAPTRAERLSSSIWLPWAVGLILLLLLALAAILLVGRDRGTDGVPESVIVAQERAAQASAQNFRRSTNEAVADLVSAAAQLQVAPAAPTAGTLEEMLSRQNRWSALAVVDPEGRIAASAGDSAIQEWSQATVNGTGLVVAELQNRARIVSHAPLEQDNPNGAMVLGLSDTHILDALLDKGTVGTSYATDPEHWVLAFWGPDSVRQRRGNPIQGPPVVSDPEVRAVASQASSGEVNTKVVSEGDSSARVVSGAPVLGRGPSGELGWSLVVERIVAKESSALPYSLRAPSLLLGLILIPFTAAIFLWILVRLIRPILRLKSQSEQVAYGDLRKAVTIGPYDDVGRIARSVERLRTRLIKDRVGPRARRPKRKRGRAAE